MNKIDRHTPLYTFGIASVSSLIPQQASANGIVAAAKPGESRFPFSTALETKLSPCKLTAEDSGGTVSAFELRALPKCGPYEHDHHKEDEWYYVLSGDFLFKVAGETHTLPTRGSIWLPRTAFITSRQCTFVTWLT